MARLKDILLHQRKLNFVGRQKEIAFFEHLLKEEEPSIHLLYIYGPGGQGKTTLLKQFADRCKETSVPFIQLDCRYIESHPGSLKEAFDSQSPFDKSKGLIESIEAHTGNTVLLIDTFEKLKPLDDWLRLEFLPELPENVITVISGRSHLSTNWKTDSGWQSITKIFALKELSEEESKQLLEHRNIPIDQLHRIISYTHGNPLALSVVADMFDQRKDSRFDPLDSPDIMKTILDQFIQEVPSPAHKAVLDLCSLVNVTTEKLIEEVLGVQVANELFNWLASLTFIEKGWGGLYPHDLARDAITKLYEAFGRADISTIVSHVADDCEWIGAGEGYLPQGGTYTGKDAINFFKRLSENEEFNAFNPVSINNINDEEVIAVGDMTATSKATGKMISCDWIMHWKFNDDGKVVYFHDFFDTAAGYFANQKTDNSSGKPEQNTRIVKKAFDDFLKGNIQGVIDASADDIEWGSHMNPTVPYAKTYHGKKGVADFFGSLADKIDYTKFQLDEYFADGDKVFVKGRHEAKVKSTGKTFGHDFLMEFSLRDDKVSNFYAWIDSREQAEAFRL